MMPNSYAERWNFQFAPNNHYGFFFLHTLPLSITFMLEFVLFMLKLLHFLIKRCSVWFLSEMLTRLAENDVIMTRCKK